jgi:hypothetical protein
MRGVCILLVGHFDIVTCRGVRLTNNRFWIRGLDLLVLLYNYTQSQPLIMAHSQWLPKARSVSFWDYECLLIHCGWLVDFLAADQFTLSLTGSLSDLSLIHLANCSPFITFCELHTEHLTPLVPVSCICGNCLFMYALSQERAYRLVSMEIHVNDLLSRKHAWRSRWLAVDVCSDFSIPAFRHHVTLLPP